MPALDICGRTYDIDCVVFDKDGTLIDFDALWAGRMERGVDRVLALTGLGRQHRAPFLTVLGVDPATSRVIPESPLAVSTIAKLGVACSVLLHQAGMPWHAAESATTEAFMPEIDTLPTASDLVPIGDMRGLLARLTARGIRVAVLTSDDRAATEASLPLLGIDRDVVRMVCGNDPLPNKPAPDGLLHLARELGVLPARMAMVGDSVTDMRTGRNAGVACCLGVLSGTGKREAISAYAHEIADDIHAFGV